MTVNRIRWLIFFLVVLNAVRAQFESSNPLAIEPWAIVIVVCIILFILRDELYGYAVHNPLLYKLRRTHGAIADKIVRPFGKPGLLERVYVRLRPPKWCRRSKDDLMLIYRDQKKLMNEGEVVVAMLVQANAALFKKGFDDAPANVIYTEEPVGDNPLQSLQEIAHRIFGLKGTKPDDPDEQKFAGMVSYEYGRDFRVTVPDKLAGGLDVTYTTIMVHRKHLPQGYLANGFFPLLVHQESRAAMILPARYWSKELLEDWGVS